MHLALDGARSWLNCMVTPIFAKLYQIAVQVDQFPRARQVPAYTRPGLRPGHAVLEQTFREGMLLVVNNAGLESLGGHVW